MFKTKKFKLFVLGVAAFSQLYVVSTMVLNQETVLRTGTEYKMKTEPVDPYDPFRGKYVRLNVDNILELPPTETYKRGETVYAIFTVDELGFITISAIQRKKPAHQRFVKTTLTRAYLSTKNSKVKPEAQVLKVRVDLPFERFYLEESIAPQAETLYRKHNRNNKQNAHITFKVLNGKAVLSGLFIKGIPVSEFVRSFRN